MPTQHWKGPVIPAGNDDLLTGWSKAFDTAGVIVQADSVDAARAELTRVETELQLTPTNTNPVYFDIGGVFYRADGSKSSTTGRWIVSPFNEIESFEGSYSAGEKITRGPSQQNALITCDIPARPYDRMFDAWGIAVGDCTVGSYNLCLLIMNGDGQLGRWDDKDGTASVGTVNKRRVPKNTDPQVILAVRSGTASTNTIQLNNNAAANKLVVNAYPVTMA